MSFPLLERQPCTKHLGMEYVKAVYLSAYMYSTIVARKTRGNRWGNAEQFVLYYSVDFFGRRNPRNIERTLLFMHLVKHKKNKKVMCLHIC